MDIIEEELDVASLKEEIRKKVEGKNSRNDILRKAWQETKKLTWNGIKLRKWEK